MRFTAVLGGAALIALLSGCGSNEAPRSGPAGTPAAASREKDGETTRAIHPSDESRSNEALPELAEAKPADPAAPVPFSSDGAAPVSAGGYAGGPAPSRISALSAATVAGASRVKGATAPGNVDARNPQLKFANGEPAKDAAPAAATPKPAVPGLLEKAPAAPAADFDSSQESYAHVPENDYLRVKDSPLSTFSIDVDTASYANIRRFLSSYQLPPPGAVRLEEMINYFHYDYAPPKDDVPFAVHCESAQCPWNTKHHLLRIALKGKVIEKEQRPVSNLVFLIDVSGSMNEPNKLPLVVASLKMLVNELTENDRVAIVVYAGAAGLVLPSTAANDKATIVSALDKLQAGGSTAGGAGIQLAYHTAVANFIKGGTNRVILCTDGDFNVGAQSQDELHKLITDSAKSGVYLSVLGFGMGNYKDTTMELLADKGNGNYAYIDTLNEGRKVFVEQMTGTLITIAKDVKIQVDFNPAHVAAYRLLGYENRILAAQDFKDDKKDAGEIGAGHTVTALYELVPPGQEIPAGDVDPSKYQKVSASEPAAEHKDEMLTVRLRYKEPDAEASKPLEFPVKPAVQEFDKTTEDFQFATAVVEFGMLLKHSKYQGGSNWDSVVEIAQGSLGKDANGYRAEFLELAKKARELAGKK